MLVRAGARFLGAAGVVAFSACGKRTPVPESPPTAPPSVQATRAVATTPPPPASALATARQVREARCDASSCDYRAEICCETEMDRHMSGCQKRPPAAEAATYGQRCSGEFSSDWIGIGCLSTQDCDAGTKCCALGELTHCATSCEEHEACVPGRPETCHAGSRCEAAESRSGGVCVVAAPSTVCGKARCGGDRPGCHYDQKKRRGTCVALDAAGAWPEWVMSSLSEDISLLRCTSPKECAGERCCVGGPLPMSECSGECMSGIDVCDTIADCPVFIGPPTGCEVDPAGPPFLKYCRYATPE